MKHLIFFSLLILISIYNLQAQFQQNSSRSLFSDVKAYKVGDALLILITEETQADNNAGTTQGRNSSIGGSINASANNSGIDAGAGIETGTNFKGNGKTTRQERIRSKISVRVVEVEQNGNLKIEGTRITKINGEEQTIVIKGVVRPVDITSANTIFSYNIMDLVLRIEGDGIISQIQEPGLITKFLRFLF